MLSAGQTINVFVERPAAGGRMIARVDGQIVLVAGAVPGERVSARIERIGRGVVYADTVGVDEASPDRRDPPADPACGGCLYAHIAYERQLEIKSLVIADAFARIGRLPLSKAVAVAASPPHGYRMRARLHRRGRLFGFFREGSHELCDARPTGQLLAATCDVLDALGQDLVNAEAVDAIEIAENIAASERVVHLHAGMEGVELEEGRLPLFDGLTGVTMTARGGWRIVRGSPYVTDSLTCADGTAIHIRRHVLAFFQGNRHLLGTLVDYVVDQVPEHGLVIDLYAGGGVFSVAAARRRSAAVTAVEGDRIASDDLVANVQSSGSDITAMHQPVEAFVRAWRGAADVVIVDPPRTGLSKEAAAGVVGLRPPRLVYVSCDIATLARDARRLVDAGYAIAQVTAFDLFPNTPHVETVVVLER